VHLSKVDKKLCLSFRDWMSPDTFGETEISRESGKHRISA
jgi:hypothetical protein